MVLTNLLRETNEILRYNGKTPVDVLWVGSRGGEYKISWEEFVEIAAGTEYDSGYGAQEVASDLVIVGSDWWLSRREYDGSEWWSYHTIPIPASSTKKFSLVTKEGAMWDSLAEMNDPYEE